MNTFVTLTSHALNPEIFIVAGARTESAESRLLAAGANRVSSMHRIAGRRMALAAMQPMLVDVVDTLVALEPGTVLGELLVQDEAAQLAGSTIANVFAKTQSMHVLGLKRADTELTVGPAMDTVLRFGDRLIIHGPQDEVEGLHATQTAHAESAGGSG